MEKLHDISSGSGGTKKFPISLRFFFLNQIRKDLRKTLEKYFRKKFEQLFCFLETFSLLVITYLMLNLMLLTPNKCFLIPFVLSIRCKSNKKVEFHLSLLASTKIVIRDTFCMFSFALRKF